MRNLLTNLFVLLVISSPSWVYAHMSPELHYRTPYTEANSYVVHSEVDVMDVVVSEKDVFDYYFTILTDPQNSSIDEETMSSIWRYHVEAERLAEQCTTQQCVEEVYYDINSEIEEYFGEYLP